MHLAYHGSSFLLPSLFSSFSSSNDLESHYLSIDFRGGVVSIHYCKTLFYSSYSTVPVRVRVKVVNTDRMTDPQIDADTSHFGSKTLECEAGSLAHLPIVTRRTTTNKEIRHYQHHT